MAALAGAIADPGAYREDTRKLVARAARTTTTSTTTSEIAVLQLDGVRVLSSRAYKITVPPLQVNSSAGDVVSIRLRYTTDGSTATTSSTVLRYAQTTIRTGTPQEPIGLQALYVPSADQSLSIVLTVGRVSGAGGAYIEGGADRSAEIIVEHLGVDPGDTGVVL